MKQIEHQIQAAFVQWADWHEGRHPALRLGFAVPNGGLRHKATAGKLKAEGVKAGVPDWILPVRAAGYSGLAIEFKSQGGKLSDDQKRYRNLMIAAGWKTVVCFSVDEAIAVTKQYLAKLTQTQVDLIFRAMSI